MTCALDKELPQKAEAIVREAGSIILGRLEQPKDIYHKGRIDLVTNTDLEVEKQLQSQLSIILPQASFLSEESMPTNKLNDLTWVRSFSLLVGILSSDKKDAWGSMIDNWLCSCFSTSRSVFVTRSIRPL